MCRKVSPFQGSGFDIPNPPRARALGLPMCPLQGQDSGALGEGLAPDLHLRPFQAQDSGALGEGLALDLHLRPFQVQDPGRLVRG